MKSSKPTELREAAIEELKRTVAGAGEWFALSEQQRSEAVAAAKPGSQWINIKSRKVVTIGSISHWSCGVTILHERGRVTIKQGHYFAYDYCPKPAIPQ